MLIEDYNACIQRYYVGYLNLFPITTDIMWVLILIESIINSLLHDDHTSNQIFVMFNFPAKLEHSAMLINCAPQTLEMQLTWTIKNEIIHPPVQFLQQTTCIRKMH